MTTNNELIKLLKNDDTEALNKIYIKYKWDKYLNFSIIYENIKDDSNTNIHHFMGYMYNTGKGVDKDYSKAIEYYQKSADQGHAIAQNNLGVMYDKGDGVEQDYTKALEYYQLSADQGHASAQNNSCRIFNGNKKLRDCVSNLVKKQKHIIKELKEENAKLVEENTELKYRPGNIGYQDAKEHFDSLKN